jgi:mono/diheme cytochrome c family protein
MKRRFSVVVTFGLLALFAAATYMPVTAGADAPTDEWKAPARASRKKNPIPADDKSIAAGKAVYVAQCVKCHGDAGKGNGPQASALNPKPKDLTDPKVTDQTDGAIFWKITTGKTPMPTFEKLISEDERWHVTNYIRSLAPATQPAPAK